MGSPEIGLNSNPYLNSMWKTINPGEKVSLGAIVRYQPSTYNSSYKEQIYQVVKTEQHYFEIIARPDNGEISETQ